MTDVETRASDASNVSNASDASDASDASTLDQMLAILSPPERRELVLLLPAVIGMALLEAGGVASIVPFLGLLADPGAIDRSRWLSWAYREAGFASHDSFFFAVGVGVLALVTVGNAVSAFTTWALLRFSWMRNHSLSTRLLAAYLAQPYPYFLKKSGADLSKNILSEVQSVVTGIMVQGLQLCARVIVTLGISLVLLLVDPIMAAGVTLVFGGIYGGLFFVTRQATTRGGEERVRLNKERFRIAGEALQGVKELKLYGLEDVAVREFAAPSRALAGHQAKTAVLGQVPRFGLETIAFGGVLAMILYMLGAGRPLHEVLPVVGLYAFAAYRMLPGLQVIFAGLTTVRFNLGALRVLYEDLRAKEDAAAIEEKAKAQQAIEFKRALRVENVTFHYEDTARASLRGVDVTLERGKWLALVGATGAGKSTLADIMLGILAPSSGVVLVDDVALTNDSARRAWAKNVAYVPQQIFLVDDTIARNICFGLPTEEIDEARMRWAARVAQAAPFIEALPKGYLDHVGERGNRLSGGQRQRIGVARALYRKPRLLVLDEATSAVDTATETAFFAELKKELADVSVISIAHRLTTTRDFDTIVVLANGSIVERGTYADLNATSAFFRAATPEKAEAAE